MPAAAQMLELIPEESALLICDMQEKFRAHIKYFPQILQVIRRMIEGAKLLDMKILATGIGDTDTVPELELQKHAIPVFEKSKFSMCVPDVCRELRPHSSAGFFRKLFNRLRPSAADPATAIRSLIICGIEAHVQLYQTAIDFQKQGYNVHVVVDASFPAQIGP